MNYSQRAYDSYDRSNFNLKIANSYYHFKNIQKILYRKPEYKKNSPPKLRINTQLYHNNYFVIRQNELYKKIINGIRDSKVKPKINNYYQMKEEKLREYKKQNKTLQNRQLSKDNINFKKRLRNQKSLLRIRDMDKEYKNNHLKMVERSKKIKRSKNFILPPINTIVNRIHSPTKFRNVSYGSATSKDGDSLPSRIP